MSGPVSSEPRSPLQTSSSPPQPPEASAAGEELPSVAEWLRGLSVLVTGATGFIGQLLVEKILRSCPDVDTVYLLVRDKRGEPPQRRIDRLLKDSLFERVRGRRDKLALVAGDLGEPGLGLSPDDRAALLRRVNVVFHCAATVRFDAGLRVAAAVNVRATGDVLRLARDMPGLQALVHLSTAYANCPHLLIEERMYKPRMTAGQLLNIVDALDDNCLDRITPVLMDPWPNSYCFTKAIAEDYVLQESKGLPLCVVRPSMVVGTMSEPMAGWINNINGPAGVVAGVGLGLLRTIYLHDGDMTCDMVPADTVVNATLAAAWRAANSRKENINPAIADGQEMPIYNCVSSPRNPITWNQFFEYNKKNGFYYPSEHCFWYYFLIRNRSLMTHYVLRIVLHLLPALLVDTFLRCTGRKPMLWKAYRKIHKFLDVTYYFGLHQWTFTDTNMQWLWNEMKESDKKVFPFNIEDINWEENIKLLIPGLRVHVYKDPLSTLEKAQVKYTRLKILHYTLVAALWLLLLKLLWWSVSMLWL